MLSETGVLILEVAADGEAGRLGLTKGDVLLGINGMPIASVADLGKVALASGKAVVLRVWRERHESTLKSPR